MASSELLKQIQPGKALNKAQTRDRSAPLIDAPKGGGAARVGDAGGPAPPSVAGSGGPPQLGGLFAGGMPKLKATDKASLGAYIFFLTSSRCTHGAL